MHRPRTGIGDVIKYPTIEMAGAALLYALVHDHLFHNGNRRLALVSMLVFLEENGLVLTCDEDELCKMVLQLAQHFLVFGPRQELPDREALAVVRWIKERSRWIERGDGAIVWRRLKQILTTYGSEFTIPGNRVNISRPIIRRTRILCREKRALLRTQISYTDEGREIQPCTINRIRKDPS